VQLPRQTFRSEVQLRNEGTNQPKRLPPEMKQTERSALALRTREGIPAGELAAWPDESREFIGLGLLREFDGNFVLTPRGKLLADSVAEAFV
jgi:oxygen-independent coproporphyrinogen-3 oxidase